MMKTTRLIFALPLLIVATASAESLVPTDAQTYLNDSIGNGEMTTMDKMLSEGISMIKEIHEGKSKRATFANSSLSDFSMMLNEGGGNSLPESMAVWGKFNYLEFDGDDDRVDFDGDSYGVQIGFDGRLSNDMLAGVALSWQKADADYTMAPEQSGGQESKGEHETEIFSIHPYISGNGSLNAKGDSIFSQIDWWASLGYGDGEVEHTPEGQDGQDDCTGNMGRACDGRDASLLTVSVGMRSDAMQKDNWALRVRTDASVSQLDVDKIKGDDMAEDVEIKSNRVRLAVEAQPEVAAGSPQPTLTAGIRHDGGDGDTGTGLELEASISHSVSQRLTAEGNIHVLTLRDDYDEWGISGTVRYQPGAHGHGLGFSVEPKYGDLTSNINEIFEEGFESESVKKAADDAVDPSDDYAMQLNASVDYGMFISDMGALNGLLTPYAKANVSDTTDIYRVGMKWAKSSPIADLANTKLSLDLFGAAKEAATNNNDESRLVLKGTLAF